MSFSISTMPEISIPQQIDTPSAVNTGKETFHEKSDFNSLVRDNSLKSSDNKEIVKSNSDSQIDKKHSEIKNKTTDKADNDIHLSGKEKDESIQTGNDTDKSANNNEYGKAAGSSLITEDLLLRMINKCVKGNPNDVSMHSVIGNASEDVTESDIKAASLLLDMISKYISGEPNDSLKQTATENLPDGTSEAVTENDIKTGALLLSIINKYSSGELDDSLMNNIIKGVNGQGTEAVTVRGLKAAALLYMLEKSVTKLTNDLQNSPQNNNDISQVINNVSAQQKSDSAGTSADSLLFDTVSGHKDAVNKHNEANADGNRKNEIPRAVVTQSDEIKGSIKGLFSNLSQNGNIEQNHARLYQLQETMIDMDMQENGDNIKTLINRMISEIAGELSHDKKSGGRIHHDAKHFHVHGETEETGLINNPDSKGGNSRAGGILITANAAKPSGFHELMEKAVYIVRGNNRLGVTVEHENLGKLDIRLSLEKGVVHVQIDTSDKAIREFVENNVQQIVETLSKNGVSVGGFSVALKNYKNNEGNPDANGNKNIISSGNEKEYMKETERVHNSNGLVSIFV